MSSVNYSLTHKGVRLVPADKAWVKGSNGKYHLNRDYAFVGKVDLTMPNMIVTAKSNAKPSFRGDTHELNRTAKKQIIEHFYDDKGKRNKKTVAYLAIEKNKEKRGKK